MAQRSIQQIYCFLTLPSLIDNLWLKMSAKTFFTAMLPKSTNTGMHWTTEPLLPAQAIPTRKTKKVKFNQRVSICFTIPLHDISPQEVKAAWYTNDELAQVMQSCCKQIQKLDRGKRLKDVKYCARGLESDTRLASLIKKKNRSLAYKVVLEEQDRQRREGVQEAEYLAYLYHCVTSSCQLWANTVGMTDQRTAEEMILDEQITQESRLSRRMTSDKLMSSPLSPWRIRKIELARADRKSVV